MSRPYARGNPFMSGFVGTYVPTDPDMNAVGERIPQAGEMRGRYPLHEGLAWNRRADRRPERRRVFRALAGPHVRQHPTCCSALVIVSAVACVIGATIVIALADRRELAELGLLGSALMAASVMPLVHGLVTPDVLYNDTEAFRTSVFLSLPIAIAAGAPLLTPHSAFGRWAARHWRDWSLMCLLGVFAIGVGGRRRTRTRSSPPTVEPCHDRRVRGADGWRARAVAAPAALLRAWAASRPISAPRCRWCCSPTRRCCR